MRSGRATAVERRLVGAGGRPLRLPAVGARRAAPAARGSQHPEPPPGLGSSREGPGAWARSQPAGSRRPGPPSSLRALALLLSLIFFDNFGGKDFQLWGEFVSSLLNSETESSKVLMCMCLFFSSSSIQMNAKPRIESRHPFGVSFSRYFTRKTKLGLSYLYLSLTFAATAVDAALSIL